MKPSTSLVLHVSIVPATVNWALKPSEAAAQDPDFWTCRRVWMDHMRGNPAGETTSSWPSNWEVTAWKRSLRPVTASPCPRTSIAQALSAKQIMEEEKGQHPLSRGKTIWASLWHREEPESALRTHAPKNPWEGYRKGGNGEACVKRCHLGILPLLLPSSLSHS